MPKLARGSLALVLCLLPSLGAAEQNTFYSIDGTLADDRLGVSVTSTGDVNGDGVNDLVVGARYADIGNLNPSLTHRPTFP